MAVTISMIYVCYDTQGNIIGAALKGGGLAMRIRCTVRVTGQECAISSPRN